MDGANDTAEIVKEFLIESYEGLDQTDQDLLELERNGADAARIGRIFRCIHTIKGTCGFLGFSTLESVAHVGENLLAGLRGGTIAVTPRVTDTLLMLGDAIREMLDIIDATGSDGHDQHEALIAALHELVELPISAHAAAEKDCEIPPAPADPLVATPSHIKPDPAQAPPSPLGHVLVERGHAEPVDVAAALGEQANSEARLGEIMVNRGYTTSDAVREALDTQDQQVDGRSSGAIADATIRVDVELLDRLMNLVGELVLARNQLLQLDLLAHDPAHSSTTQRLNLITTELQEGVMKTRMQPIGNVWSRFPRVVRDLALSCGKQVVVDMEGADTELDKTIIEAIKDPLTHIVRNAVDHGIETPVERVHAGKSPEGHLQLRAYHEGGKVNIEIRDDGRGMDVARLKTKAIDMGVLRPEAAAHLSDRDALALVFHAGLSTATTVTNVSGRGVGMDVVRSNIERIGGTIDLISGIGQGTTLRIKIPLTLAIIPGLIVKAGAGSYAIPQVNLLELVRLEGEEALARIEHVYDAPVLRLRGKLLPLIHLGRALGVAPAAGADDTSEDALRVMNIVVLQTEGLVFGVVVDAVSDTEEIVVKPLGPQLKGIAAFAGATIMGDGRVALILDVHGLALSRGLLSHGDRQGSDHKTEARATTMNVQQLLLVGIDDIHTVAFPLHAIARLEEVKASSIEWTGSHEVVQYRDRILPIVRLDHVLEGMALTRPADDGLSLIVYEDATYSIGFAAARILDVVETPADALFGASSGALSTTTVINGRVTDILDVPELLARLHGLLPPSLLGSRHQELTRV